MEKKVDDIFSVKSSSKRIEEGFKYKAKEEITKIIMVAETKYGEKE